MNTYKYLKKLHVFAVNLLDNSDVHPESYKLVQQICKDAKTSVEELVGNETLINQINWSTKDLKMVTKRF